MKMYRTLTVCCLLAVSSFAFSADVPTDLSKNWTCTTNASTGSTDADKAADDQAANNKSSANDAFSMASKICRDCTKITCEVNS